MNAQNEKTAAREAVRAVVPCDVSEEIALPDYMPAVRRVVAFSAVPLDENRYLDPSSLEASGVLCCSVTYVGEDMTLNSYPVNCEYSVRLPLRDGALSADGVTVRTAADAPVCRATAPRKLTVGAKLSVGVYGVAPEKTDPEITVRDGSDPTAGELAGLEYLRVPLESSSVKFVSASGETRGTLTFPGTGDGGTRLVSCSGVSCVTGVAPCDDGVSVRGETTVFCLALTPDGEYAAASVKTPFEERISAGFTPDGGAAFATCASVNVSDAGGGSFECAACHEISAEAWRTEKTEVTVDAYSPDYGDETVMKTTETVVFAGSAAASFTASGTGRAPSPGKVLFSTGRASPGGAEISPDGKAVFTGQATVTAVVASDGDAEPVDVTFPFRFETALRGGAAADGETAVRWEPVVTATDVRPDGDRLNVSAEISVCASATAKKKTETAAGVILDRDAPVEKASSRVRVVFTDGGETGWDVRRRYRADPDSVKELDRAVVITGR